MQQGIEARKNPSFPIIIMPKDPQEYSVDEVSIWLAAIGLGDKAEAFKENAVDGAMLCTLETEDFSELGLTSLQGKKVQRSLETTKEMFSAGGDPEALAALQKEVAALKEENAALKAQLEKYAPKPKAAPAPAPAPPPKQKQPAGRPVVRGAAGGAAKGAVLGAVAGAVAGNPGQGAKMGAAVGGTAGGMRGMGERRRARMMRY